MKVTLESTERVVTVHPFPFEARVWQGHTENGIPVVCLIARVAVSTEQNQAEFEAQLQAHAAPNEFAKQAFPLRLVL